MAEIHPATLLLPGGGGDERGKKVKTSRKDYTLTKLMGTIKKIFFLILGRVQEYIERYVLIASCNISRMCPEILAAEVAGICECVAR